MNLMEKYIARMTNNKGVNERPDKPLSSHESGLAILKMPLNEFESAGLILKVRSEVLKEHVYFVSGDSFLNRCNTLDVIAYTSQELQAILDMTPEEVKAAHEVKRVFHKARVIAHRKAVNG